MRGNICRYACYDAGRVVNPKLAHSQAIGGMVGGIEMALLEGVKGLGEIVIVGVPRRDRQRRVQHDREARDRPADPPGESALAWKACPELSWRPAR
jgi:hypothetical protein